MDADIWLAEIARAIVAETNQEVDERRQPPAELKRPRIDLGKECNRSRRERDREQTNASKKVASLTDAARAFGR